MKKSNKKQPFLMMVLGAIAGGVAANTVKNLIPIENELVKNGVVMGAGVFLGMQKNDIVKGVGLGMAVNGGSSIVSSFTGGGIGRFNESFFDEQTDVITDENGNILMLNPASGNFEPLAGPASLDALAGPASLDALAGNESYM